MLSVRYADSDYPFELFLLVFFSLFYIDIRDIMKFAIYIDFLFFFVFLTFAYIN